MGIKYLTRLRLGFKHLKKYKFNRNLTENYLFLEKYKLVEYCYFQSKNIVEQRKY